MMNQAATKQTKTLSLSGFDIAVCASVLNVPGANHTIADLRLTREAMQYFKSIEDAHPEHPGAKPQDPEKAAEYEQKAKEFIEKMNLLAEAVKEVEMPLEIYGLVRKRLTTFRGFYNDERSREKVLALAEKFGI